MPVSEPEIHEVAGGQLVSVLATTTAGPVAVLAYASFDDARARVVDRLLLLGAAALLLLLLAAGAAEIVARRLVRDLDETARRRRPAQRGRSLGPVRPRTGSPRRYAASPRRSTGWPAGSATCSPRSGRPSPTCRIGSGRRSPRFASTSRPCPVGADRGARRALGPLRADPDGRDPGSAPSRARRRPAQLRRDPGPARRGGLLAAAGRGPGPCRLPGAAARARCRSGAPPTTSRRRSTRCWRTASRTRPDGVAISILLAEPDLRSTSSWCGSRCATEAKGSPSARCIADAATGDRPDSASTSLAPARRRAADAWRSASEDGWSVVRLLLGRP